MKTSNPLLHWIDLLWDVQANHLGHWITLLWTVLQIGMWFGVGIRCFGWAWKVQIKRKR